MKQLFLSATLCWAMFFAAIAQTDGGTLLLGGNITFVAAEDSRLNASPNLGIFVLNDVAAIAKFSLEVTDADTRWAIGPTIRLYLFGNDRGKFIVQSGVNVGGAKDSDTAFGFDVGAGYAAFLNESIALDFLANFTKTGDEKGIFTLGAGFQIHYNR